MRHFTTLLLAALLSFSLGCGRESGASRATAAKPDDKGIKIVEWNVTYKSRKSTGSVQTDWKIHLKNESDKPKRGQLWFLGFDKEGFECHKDIYEIMTTIPGNGEIKKIHEVYYQPGEYERIETYKILWKPM